MPATLATRSTLPAAPAGTAPPGRAPWSPSRLSPTLAALLEGDSSGAGVAVVLGLLQVQNWLLDLWTVTLGGQVCAG